MLQPDCETLARHHLLHKDCQGACRVLPQSPRYTCRIMIESTTTAYAAQRTMAQVCPCIPQSVHGSKVVSKVLAVLVSHPSSSSKLCADITFLGESVDTGAVNLLLQAHQSLSEPTPAGRLSPKHLLGSGARRRRGASQRAQGATTLHRSSERCSTATGTWTRWAPVIYCREHMASTGCGFIV